MVAAPVPVHDLVGVGLGPSNLALAVALHDFAEAGRPAVDACFLEQRGTPAWHPGMLLAGSRLQVSFLKDLATLRDPRSSFTFLAYLHQKGRLDHFVNLADFRASRHEFDDYLRWAADRLGDAVQYGRRVVSLAPVVGAGSNGAAVEAIAVTSVNEQGCDERVLHARHLAIGTGLTPRVPPGVEARRGGPIFHTAAFLQRIAELGPADEPCRFLVVGEGQSAAEVVAWLHEHFPRSTVTAAMRGLGLRPADDSPFVNEAFFPDHVDLFYGLSDDKREELLVRLRNTNYSVADMPLIEELYRRMYQEMVSGERRLVIRRYLDLKAAREMDGVVRAEFYDWVREETVPLEADRLVLATGYHVEGGHPLLAGLGEHVAGGPGGQPVLERDYSVRCAAGFAPRIFLHGRSQASHGIADTLLSVAAVRATEIAESLHAALA